MNYFVGIDLGTTNSAISVYDGENVKILKSREQTDVTPSAILYEPRGRTHYGKKAYDSAPWREDSVAVLFKRFMGTDHKIEIKAQGLEKTPIECSAELLKWLNGYVNEEIRPNIRGTVITVPAEFNQKQKDATREASELANIGKVALMQEPVAAIMSVMQKRKTDGDFYCV